jgi:hypothetical protein
MRLNSFILISICLAAGACGGNPTSPSEMSSMANAVSCPVGSYVDASANAQGDCGGNAGAYLKDESGKVQAKCVQGSQYTVKCVVSPDLCKYGAKEFTRDEVVCAEAPSAPSATSAPSTPD